MSSNLCTEDYPGGQIDHCSNYSVVGSKRQHDPLRSGSAASACYGCTMANYLLLHIKTENFIIVQQKI